MKRVLDGFRTMLHTVPLPSCCVNTTQPDAPALGLGTHSEVHGRNADSARHMIGLASDDLTADWKRLKQSGVEFIEDPTDYGALSIATLKDPEGNLVQLWQYRSS